MMKILLRNRQRSIRLDLEKVAKIAQNAAEACAELERLGADVPSERATVEISLVSDRRMAALHRQFLQVRGSTDVITFAHGEIVISAPTAMRAAKAHSEVLEREICRYAVHGLLHLRGYDDATPHDRARMWAAQEAILHRLWPEAGA